MTKPVDQARNIDNMRNLLLFKRSERFPSLTQAISLP
jgi:hypothetical protein